ncbi:MAG: hypothetical protein AAFN93_06745 [Bacteroidota bacterium]
MNTLIKKQAIIQAVESMNAKEAEQVMKYIKDLLYNPRNDFNYLELKRRALNEIQEALNVKPEMSTTLR